MKIAVYSAIFGEKDHLKDPLNYNAGDNIDYFIFTDNAALESDIYKIVYRKPKLDDVTKNARFYKVMGDDLLAGYDLLIWHDGNVQLYHDQISSMISYLTTGAAMATFKHPVRDNYYDEAIACVRYHKESAVAVSHQILKYFRSKVPVNIGLFETTILVKRNSTEFRPMFVEWWNQINKYSRRDQLGLVYALWKTGQSVAIMPGRGLKNGFANYQSHQHGMYYKRGKKNRANSRISIAAVSVLFRILKAVRSGQAY